MRYFVFPQRIDQKVIHFTDLQTHHMRKVLRLKPGDHIECFNDKGFEYKVEIKKLSSEGSFGVIVESIQHDIVGGRRITLLQSFPSALPKLDLVVEKCTELGIDHFAFFKSKRSELRVLPSDEKQNRWRKITVKASEQSRRYSIPSLLVLNNLDELDLEPYQHKILLYEKSENLSLHSIITESADLDSNIVIAVGPEGGWEDAEVQKFHELGFIDVKPFDTILRTETAAIAITSALKIK